MHQRTATLNRIRGLLSEFGVVLPLKAEVVRREACNHLEDLPGYANTVIGDLLNEVQDGAPSSIEALPAIVEAVGHRPEVWMEGGIRSGEDVLKAWAGASNMLVVPRRPEVRGEA